MTRVEVLGPGCRRCPELDRLAREITGWLAAPVTPQEAHS